MTTDRLRGFLDQPSTAFDYLRSWGLEDVQHGHASLVSMAESGVTLDLLATICNQLAAELPGCPAPDMALNNLDRFVVGSRNPLSLASLFERDPEALQVLVQIFSTSQYLADLLISDSEAYDLLRMTEGQPVARDLLVEELAAEVEALPDVKAVMAALRRFKRRETLRVAYGDIIRGQRLETVTSQISYVADATIDAAVRIARRELEQRRGVPRRADGQPARFVVLGMGKLGGTELNYSSDIDLILIYEEDGQTDGARPVSNREFFERLSQDAVKLLTEKTDLGAPYRVDLRLRPEGRQGPVVISRDSALHYYDVYGRTWERQAYIKARAVAGDLDLGRELLAELEPWIYRRYLGLADITGIKALKRRIEQRATRDGGDQRDVKTGRGGIRDIEFSIQFLQLLNGGDLPELRTGNTLEAMDRLEKAGCLTTQERSILDENYRFLRKIEHRLQIMFDLQTHLMPDDPAELGRLALRMGYRDAQGQRARERFEADYGSRTALNRKILDFLLHDAFGDDSQEEPEVDLILDPEPQPERIVEVLSRYGFRDPEAAYRHLSALATEKIHFLSTRRCRHFLASIASRLLAAISETTDPDSTLVNLAQVSDSLGGKGVLWELFSFNQPSLRLYVELCASSPYLSAILTSNPGMIDELMDSLVLNKLPTLEWLSSRLGELCRAAEDLDPILHSFKNAQQLGVGVRDILRKEDIHATTGALSDIAQACLEQITVAEQAKLVEKLGQPTIGTGPRAGEPCELVIVAMGKFGGRELNYHSDLDVIFLYESEGQTVLPRRARRGQSTTNQHFFGELGTRIIKAASYLGPQGRLYEVDARLRPTGRSGSLATSLDELVRYFTTGEGQLWERLALCRARVVYGTERATAAAQRALIEAIDAIPFGGGDVARIRDMRRRLEETAGPDDLKRGRGGLVDIEFIVQSLQLAHGRDNPAIRRTNVLEALDALRDADHLSADDHEALVSSYRLLRTMEAKLRLMSTAARDALPTDAAEAAKLARLLDYPDVASLERDFRKTTADTRQRFERILGQLERATSAKA